MLKRKIEFALSDWKEDKEHKPLIVKGCRQCGKTYSVLDFARKNYRNVVYLNFFENPDYAAVCELLGNKLPSFLLQPPLQ